jgi:hypothetical protein
MNQNQKQLKNHCALWQANRNFSWKWNYSIATHSSLRRRKPFQGLSWDPRLFGLRTRSEWSRVSKALCWSKNTAPVTRPQSYSVSLWSVSERGFENGTAPERNCLTMSRDGNRALGSFVWTTALSLACLFLLFFKIHYLSSFCESVPKL